MKILIINGPNLNMIGKREEKFYGVEDFETILEGLKEKYPDLELGYFQSNSEGDIITKIQQAEEEKYQGMVINAGGYSHYSVSIHDAILTLNIPRVEVHFSNIYARDVFRQKSVLSAACNGVIAGFGKQSYALALQWFTDNQRKPVGFR